MFQLFNWAPVYTFSPGCSHKCLMLRIHDHMANDALEGLFFTISWLHNKIKTLELPLKSKISILKLKRVFGVIINFWIKHLLKNPVKKNVWKIISRSIWISIVHLHSLKQTNNVWKKRAMIQLGVRTFVLLLLHTKGNIMTSDNVSRF